MKSFQLLPALLLCSLIGVHAQQSMTSSTTDDRAVVAQWTRHDDSDSLDPDDDDYDILFSPRRIFSTAKPAIEISAGSANAGINDFPGTFSNTFQGQIAIGSSRIRKAFKSSDLQRYSFNSLFFGAFQSRLNGLSTNEGLNPDINTKIFSFGTLSKSGYSYKDVLGMNALTLYHGGGMVWSRLSADIPTVSLSPEGPDSLRMLREQQNFEKNKSRIELFNNEFRFGTSATGGIQLQVSDLVALDLGYERAVIFPRHLFWKWAGSEIFEGIGHSAIDIFVRRVLDSRPNAAPIVDFLLHNAFSYGVYELRRTNMNWPFWSEAPLGFDSYKVGLTFSF